MPDYARPAVNQYEYVCTYIQTMYLCMYVSYSTKFRQRNRTATQLLTTSKQHPKTATMASVQQPFEFPREYHFPPFFTRQTNLNTLKAQLTKWSSLILAYCAHHRIYKLTLSQISNSSSSSSAAQPTTASSTISADTPNTEALFHNKSINRRLSLADAREVLDFMRKEGRAEYVNPSANTPSAGHGQQGDVIWIYWRTPEEWAALVEAWVDDTAQKGNVLTLYELTDGEGTRGSELHGLDSELLLKALAVLVKRGKAQVFGSEDSQGVKFF
jgi:ESCRT-II complex subunit VPS25